MSTFNGEKFLKAQLNSILAQTMACSILIRDDGSSDKTPVILKQYANQFPNIILLNDSNGHLGVIPSYYYLLKATEDYFPDYVLYADQDDIWLPNKIQNLLEFLATSNTFDGPLLVFSDAYIVSNDLKLIHTSNNNLQKHANINNITLKKLLFFCPGLGCTMMINRKLFKLAVSLPILPIFPDKLLLLLAQIHGRIFYLPKSTVLYRQHANNVIGGLNGILRQTLQLRNIQFLSERYQTAINQAQLVLQNFPALSVKNKRVIIQFLHFFTENRLKRVWLYFQFCLTPPHWKRKLGVLLSLFLRYNIKNQENTPTA